MLAIDAIDNISLFPIVSWAFHFHAAISPMPFTLPLTPPPCIISICRLSMPSDHWPMPISASLARAPAFHWLYFSSLSLRLHTIIFHACHASHDAGTPPLISRLSVSGFSRFRQLLIFQFQAMIISFATAGIRCPLRHFSSRLIIDD